MLRVLLSTYPRARRLCRRAASKPDELSEKGPPKTSQPMRGWTVGRCCASAASGAASESSNRPATMRLRLRTGSPFPASWAPHGAAFGSPDPAADRRVVEEILGLGADRFRAGGRRSRAGDDGAAAVQKGEEPLESA